MIFLANRIGNHIKNKSVPRFRLSVTYTSEDVIEYDALFYKVFRINHDTPNEYYIVDNSKKYNVSTVPKSPFNRTMLVQRPICFPD